MRVGAVSGALIHPGAESFHAPTNFIFSSAISPSVQGLRVPAEAQRAAFVDSKLALAQHLDPQHRRELGLSRARFESLPRTGGQTLAEVALAPSIHPNMRPGGQVARI